MQRELTPAAQGPGPEAPGSTTTIPGPRENGADGHGKAHLTALDGLRGFACIFVVLFHCHNLSGLNFAFLEHGTIWQLALYRLMILGYSGVDLFFVISGVCLGLPYLRSRPRPLLVLPYFFKRAWRILPPYWSAMLLFGGLGCALHSLRIEPFFSANFLAWRWDLREVVKCGTLWSAALLGSYWTLPIEWRWYLLVPPAVLFARRFGGGAAVVVALVVMATASQLAGTPGNAVDHVGLRNVLLYLPTFVSGVWIARIAGRPAEATWLERGLARYSPWGALCFTLIYFFQPPSFYRPVERVLVFGPLYFFLTLAALQAPAFRSALSRRALVGVGVFSYSLYLSHEAIIRGAAAITEHLGWSMASKLLFFAFGVFPSCILFGWLFYVLIERPMIGLKDAFGTGRAALASTDTSHSERTPEPSGGAGIPASGVVEA